VVTIISEESVASILCCKVGGIRFLENVGNHVLDYTACNTEDYSLHKYEMDITLRRWLKWLMRGKKGVLTRWTWRIFHSHNKVGLFLEQLSEQTTVRGQCNLVPYSYTRHLCTQWRQRCFKCGRVRGNAARNIAWFELWCPDSFTTLWGGDI
jgi:hypothetical protein